MKMVRALLAAMSHVGTLVAALMMALMMAMMMVGAAAAPALAQDNTITGLRSGTVTIGDDQAARVVVETSSPAEVSMLLLSNRFRLVMDFSSSRLDLGSRGTSGPLQTPPLVKYRYGKPDAMTSRLVIDLSGPAAPVRAFRLAPNDKGHRFVVDLLDRGETAFRLASKALLKNRNQPLNLGVAKTPAAQPVTMLMPLPRPPRPSPERDANGLLLPIPHPLRQGRASATPREVAPVVVPKSYAEGNSTWVVFIDAGHGGKDPGAIGVSGHQEKTVTLQAALELARQLNATGKVKAVLSRDHDTFHKLRKRIDLARRQKADVFISLHADAAENSKARGVSVFTLSDKASDKEAARLASRENKSDLIGGPDLDTTDPAVTTALLGMFQRESMNQSSVLAKEIIDEFTGLPTPKRGHRFAGFAVLKSPDIPSVLIEMGFLTNKSDEKKLKSAAYRRDLMARITRAVIRYLENSGT
ncbi:MAG: N-acetylmuramoyl-L-alanine amidase [Alphaproteobacteria bacterium]|nr:N-acetylmuramoyl-L-alanine amidase [Alphaproteobacteria bacterium]